MTAALTIARNTFIESLRQPVIFVVVLLCGMLQYINTASSGYSMGYRIHASGELTGDDKMLLDVGMATSFVGGILLAAFIATAALTREIDNKTVLTVVSKPIGRPAVIVGKFIGVTTAMAIASTILVLQLLFALRHGVMTTAADMIDWPVVVFGAGSFALATMFGAFTNFMYNWSFSQVFTLSLLPLSLLSYVVMLGFDGSWGLQPITTDLLPQVMLACLAMIGALLVITGVAVAASTRLGQVMTLVVCAGVFMIGLLSNHLIGRHAFLNDALGVIESVTFEDGTQVGLSAPPARATIRLESPPETQIEPGEPFYFGPSPNGLGLTTAGFSRPDPSVDVRRSGWSTR
jgi:ABC-2 type transport system permease protein